MDRSFPAPDSEAQDPAALASLGFSVWWWRCTYRTHEDMIGFSSLQADSHLAHPIMGMPHCHIDWHFGSPNRNKL